MTNAITRSGSVNLKKAITVLEPIKFARQVIDEAEQVKTAEGRLHESIEHTTGHLWQACLEKVFTTGEMPPEGNYPYPRGFYDAESRGSDGSIGRFSEEELLYKTLELTSIKVYIDLMRRGNTHDKDLLEGIKKINFNPAYVKKVILSSEEVLNEIRRGIKGHIGRLLAGEGSSRSGYMLSEDTGDLRKGTPPVTRAGSVELKKAAGGARGGKYYKREATGNPKKPWRYYYSEAAYKQAEGKKEQKSSQMNKDISDLKQLFIDKEDSAKKEYKKLQKIKELSDEEQRSFARARAKRIAYGRASEYTDNYQLGQGKGYSVAFFSSMVNRFNKLKQDAESALRGISPILKRELDPNDVEVISIRTKIEEYSKIADMVSQKGKPYRKSQFNADDLMKAAGA